MSSMETRIPEVVVSVDAEGGEAITLSCFEWVFTLVTIIANPSLISRAKRGSTSEELP
jgi:hypothetical protein